MARLRLKYRLKAFTELRTAQGVRDDLEERAKRIADAAGEGIEVYKIQKPFRRAHILIGTTTPESEVAEARDNTLIRAIDAGA